MEEGLNISTRVTHGPQMYQRVNTRMTDDDSGARKTNDEGIPYVTARHRTPPPHGGRGRGGSGFGETNQSADQHAQVSLDPGQSGQRGLPAAAPALPESEAPRQKPCMPA